MTIDEAIERQQNWLDTPYRETKVDFRDALKLGIEALKHCRVARKHSGFVWPRVLPGETED